MAAVQIQDVNAFHKQLALYMIAHPDHRLTQIAKHFSKTPSWISIVRNSDAFKVYYDKLVDKQLKNIDPILQSTQAMTDLALDHLNHKLETLGDVLTVKELSEVAELGLKRLGFGADLKGPHGPAIHVHNEVVVVDRGELREARERMAEVHGVGNSPKQLAAPPTITVRLHDKKKTEDAETAP